MSLNIYTYIEVKTHDGIWYAYMENDRDFFGYQDNIMNSMLFNIDNKNKIPYIDDPRGLPKDLSAEIKVALKRFNGDILYPSYLFVDEIVNFVNKNKEIARKTTTDFFLDLKEMQRLKKEKYEDVRLISFF